MAPTAEERVNAEGIGQCEHEWRDSSPLCRPHRCELPALHPREKHHCACGQMRRNMKRDEPSLEDLVANITRGEK